MQRSIITAAVVGALSVSSAPAYAQNSTYDTYGGKGTVEQEVERGSTTPAPPESENVANPPTAAPVTPVRSTPTGTLPFTGFDLGLLVLGGGVLLGVGVAMRRLSRPRRTDP